VHLLGSSTVLGPDPAEDALSRLYAHRPGQIRVNMVTSLDGAATGDDLDSGSINNPVDLRVFRVLRALADVVLVGAVTASRESYARRMIAPPLAAARRDRGQGPLSLAVVTRTGNLSADLLASPGLIVVTTTDSPARSTLSSRLGDNVISVGRGDVDLPGAIAELAGRGLTRVLCEGGPQLLGQLLRQDLVDELCLTTVPLLVGGTAPRIVAGDWLRPVRQLRLAHLLTCDGTLLGRWLLDRSDETAGSPSEAASTPEKTPGTPSEATGWPS
jgi:riboflavin biosynthesis pyrimidine reductase